VQDGAGQTLSVPAFELSTERATGMKIGGWAVNGARFEAKGIRASRWDNMVDIAYILIGVLFFIGCWIFTRICERL
jgi:hypothetical protein